MNAPRIVALGGHEFRNRPGDLAVVRHLLEMTGLESPRVCLLPTAGGDPREAIGNFYSVLDAFDCRASHVSLFRLERERVDLRAHLLGQDLIYVAGGSMLNLMAIWRAHGVGEIMRAAWRSGILLAGQSAGAMCWFESGITASAGAPEPAAGLGLMPGSLCVHYGRDPERRQTFLREVAGGGGDGFALDDGAGLLFEGTRPVDAFAGHRGARVFRVQREDTGAREQELHPIPLHHELPTISDPGLAEFRALRTRERASTIGAWRSR